MSMHHTSACHGYVSSRWTQRYAVLTFMIALAHGQTTTEPLPAPPLTNPAPSASSSSKISAHSTYSVPPVPTAPADNPVTPPSNDDGFDAANYYYAFVAIGIVLLCVIIFLWNMKRRRSKMRSRVRSQTALRQDLENWQDGQRRWLHGMHWRENPALTRYQQGRRRHREEGLNERGEAPPPYHPDEPASNLESDQRWGTGTDASGNQIAFPLQVLSRDQTSLKPPDYTENLTPVHVDVDSPNIGNHHTAAEISDSDAVNVQPTAQISNNSTAINAERGDETREIVHVEMPEAVPPPVDTEESNNQRR